MTHCAEVRAAFEPPKEPPASHAAGVMSCFLYAFWARDQKCKHALNKDYLSKAGQNVKPFYITIITQIYLKFHKYTHFYPKHTQASTTVYLHMFNIDEGNATIPKLSS